MLTVGISPETVIILGVSVPGEDDVPPVPDDSEAPPPFEVIDGGGGSGRSSRQFPYLTKSIASCCRVIRDHDLLETILGPGDLRWNELSGEAEFDGIAINDQLVIRFREVAERTVFGTTQTKKKKVVEFSHETVWHSFIRCAVESSFHPVREYLDSLVCHPTRTVIDDVAREALHLPDGLSLLIWRKFLISAVARVYDPGCKVDTVPVFIGPGRYRKSTLLRTLASDQWFTDTRMDLANQTRALMQLSGVWIAEWSEMTAMRSARDANQVKDFLSSQTDRFVPMYSRNLERRPRQMVIAGTTNQRDFLTDETGNRRFWPLDITAPIDVEMVSDMRDELWAEAVQEYKCGTPWHLDEAAEELLIEVHREYEDHDGWDPKISEWCLGKDDFRMHELLTGALGIPIGQQGSGEQRRAARCLIRAGWKLVRVRRETSNPVRIWVRAALEPHECRIGASYKNK